MTLAVVAFLAGLAGAAIGALTMRVHDRRVLGDLRYQWRLAEHAANIRAAAVDQALDQLDAFKHRVDALSRQRERSIRARQRAAL